MFLSKQPIGSWQTVCQTGWIMANGMPARLDHGKWCASEVGTLCPFKWDALPVQIKE